MKADGSFANILSTFTVHLIACKDMFAKRLMIYLLHIKCEIEIITIEWVLSALMKY